MSNTNKILTTPELLRHIAENIEKNGEWVVEQGLLMGWYHLGFKSEGGITDIIECSIAGINYRVASSEPKVTYCMGDRFVDKETSKEYILAQGNPNELCLIAVYGGNRWKNPVQVKNPDCVTEEEFAIICGGGIFTKLEKGV